MLFPCCRVGASKSAKANTQGKEGRNKKSSHEKQTCLARHAALPVSVAEPAYLPLLDLSCQSERESEIES